MEKVTVVVNTTTPFDISPTKPQIATVNTAYVLAALSLIIVILRFIVRRLNHQRYKVDDYIMLASMALLAVFTATYPVVVSMETEEGDPESHSS